MSTELRDNSATSLIPLIKISKAKNELWFFTFKVIMDEKSLKKSWLHDNLPHSRHENHVGIL